LDDAQGVVAVNGKATKSFFLKWIWRVQQIAQVSTLVMMSISLTLQISGKIEWRFGSPYIPEIFTFSLLAFVLLSLGYLWDRRFKMWVEQTEVVVERNPYMMFHMTAKEIVSNLVQWIPMYEKIGNQEGARVLEDWTKEAINVDPKVKPLADKIIMKFKAENFVNQRYPWYEG
jgi:hypothetical protein